MTLPTPVNSIVIPERFVNLCDDWHGDMGCMMYAVSSTKNLTIGTRRSWGCDTDEKWYYSIWCGLARDVNDAVCVARKGYNAEDEWDGGDGEGHDADYPALVEFENWVEYQCERLCRSYGLEDWDPCE